MPQSCRGFEKPTHNAPRVPGRTGANLYLAQWRHRKHHVFQNPVPNQPWRGISRGVNELLLFGAAGNLSNGIVRRTDISLQVYAPFYKTKSAGRAEQGGVHVRFAIFPIVLG